MAGKTHTIYHNVVADLTTAKVATGDIVETLGYSTILDSGGRAFRYSATSSATADNQFVHNGPGSVGRYEALDQGDLTVTIASGATPSVLYKRNVTLDYPAPQTITNFANGFDGQRIWVRITNANVTVAHNATIVLSTGANFTAPATGVVLQFRRDGGVWYEVCPSNTATPGVLTNRKDGWDGTEIDATPVHTIDFDLGTHDNVKVDLQTQASVELTLLTSIAIRPGRYVVYVTNYDIGGGNVTNLQWQPTFAWQGPHPQPILFGSGSMTAYIFEQFPSGLWRGLHAV